MSTHTCERNTTTRIKTVQSMLSVLLAILFGASAAIPARAADTILIVTTVADLGGSCPGANCTLRAAIAYANAYPAQDQIIGFNISGTCPQTIKIFSALPTITDTLSIRGYTQFGAAQNTSEIGDNATLCIQLQPASSGSNIANGLRFSPTDITDEFDVSGLSIGGFDDGIRIDEGSFSITGNFIGLATNGISYLINHYNGIELSHNTLPSGPRDIGGPDVAQRNVISANGEGIAIVGGQTAIHVSNNFIGTSSSGTIARGNGIGVYVHGLTNYIADNVISGNSSEGIRLDSEVAEGNAIERNRIGLKSFAVCAPPPCTPNDVLGNGTDGVAAIHGASGNGTLFNEIAWNGGVGVRLPEGVSNPVRMNSIHDNAGLGIDLGTTGVDPIDNDATATPNAPNRMLNYPTLTIARGSALDGTVQGNLQSTNGTYTIEFFASRALDPSLNGEGEEYVGSIDIEITNAPVGNNGLAGFSAPIFSTANLIGRFITATATDANRNTSEFSKGRVYVFSDVIFANGFDPAQP